MLDTFSKTAIKKTNVMKKLNLDALKERAEAIASEELLGSIAGGLEGECHNGSCHLAPTGNAVADIYVSLYNLFQIIFN